MRSGTWLAFSLLFIAACKTAANVPVQDESSITADDDGPFDPKTADGIESLFQQVVDSRPKTPAKRAVFLKPHGCASATFDIPADLPAKYKVGLFATAGPHKAWVRVSSDTVPTTRDQNNNTIGFAVKVLDVPGTKVLAGEEQFTTHDFLMQNISVFFTDTAADFLAFESAAFQGKDEEWLKAHPRTDQILKDMAKPVENVLGSRYWSTTTYRFGDKDYAKYTARPCTAPAAEAIPTDDSNYLRTRFVRDLKANEACYELQVQLRGTPAGDFPLDKATVEWDEAKSVPQTVAKITLAKQDADQNNATCENMSFTAWHALPEHRPVGSINKARGIIYKHLADERRARNNIPLTEPK
jgi:hypothetical protein